MSDYTTLHGIVIAGDVDVCVCVQSFQFNPHCRGSSHWKIRQVNERLSVQGTSYHTAVRPTRIPSVRWIAPCYVANEQRGPGGNHAYILEFRSVRYRAFPYS